MEKDNIILIGMPGCGKSTIGIVLAKMLCMDFCDVDLLIQKRAGTSLQKYIDTYGVDNFLEFEGKTVCELNCKNTVIATGGSAVLTESGAEHLRALGTLVYLQLPLEDIKKRIKNLGDRGVAMRMGEDLNDVYNYRTPIYEKLADICIDVGGDISAVSGKLADILSNKYHKEKQYGKQN